MGGGATGRAFFRLPFFARAKKGNPGCRGGATRKYLFRSCAKRTPQIYFALMTAIQPKEIPYDKIRAVEWENGRLKLIDQRIPPGKFEHLYLDHFSESAKAITDMVVRGAPAIGVTAAYAVVLAARDRYKENPSGWQKAIQAGFNFPAGGGPAAAVTLRWAVEYMRGLINSGISSDPVPRLLAEAQRIHAEDIAANRRMGEPGAGAVARGGYGTGRGVGRAVYAAGKIKNVFADKPRPWLQGARLTAWELVQEGIPVTLLADSAATYLMKQGKVKWVIVGADRIAANGDTANKIGTYMTAGAGGPPPGETTV